MGEASQNKFVLEREYTTAISALLIVL